MMERKPQRWLHNVVEWLTVEKMGIGLAVLGIVIVVLGYLDQHGTFNLRQLFHEMYANVGSGMVDIAITVLIIDRLNRLREERSEKKRLIREMSSKDNSTALRAVDELRAHGWLQDGSLVKADLKYANLEGAVLSGADLRQAYLSFANLSGADLRNASLRGAILRCAILRNALVLNADLTDTKLLEADLKSANLHGAVLKGANLASASLDGVRGVTDERLSQAGSLLRATMPTGVQYDGRYNLPEDIQDLDAKGMAAHYGISLAAYRRGQEWAQANLPRLQSADGCEEDSTT